MVTYQDSPRDSVTISSRRRPRLVYQRAFCHDKYSTSLVIPGSYEEAKRILRSTVKGVSSLTLPPRPPGRTLDLTDTPVTSRVAMICHGCHGKVHILALGQARIPVLSSTIVHAQETFRRVTLGDRVLGLFLLANQPLLLKIWDWGLHRRSQSHSSAMICLTESLTLQNLPQPLLSKPQPNHN